MKTSDDFMAKAMLKVGNFKKDSTNAYHKYAYASHEAVSRQVRTALANAGAYITQYNADVVHFSCTGDKTVAVVRETAYITCNGQDYGPYTGLGQGADSGDKAIMKASTAANKYLLAHMLLGSWGDDPEADSSTDRGSKQPKAKSRPSDDGDTEATPLPPTKKKRGRPPKPKVDSAPLLKAVEDANTLEGLREHKAAILALVHVSREAYTQCKNAYQVKAKELTNGYQTKEISNVQ